MKKGKMLKCIYNKGNEYLTAGKSYEVKHGDGDMGEFGRIGKDGGFEIKDDEGDLIYQFRLNGLHGFFEVQ